MKIKNEDYNFGKYVGDFEIVNFIGKGQFGKVYKAKEYKNHKLASIKIINKNRINKNEKLKELLNNEILIIKKINHQNIMNLIIILNLVLIII